LYKSKSFRVDIDTKYFFYVEGVGKLFSIKHVPLPTSLRPNEVLVKNDMATICGSDLHTWKGTRPAETPMVLGHEGMGRIMAKGDGRQHLSVGDRVTWSIFDRCYTCRPCTDFKVPQKCDQLFKYGHTSLAKGNGLDGCYGSHTLLRNGTHIVQIPNIIPDKLAAPINCAFATIHAALDPEKLPKNIETALVQGAGLLGIYACLVLSHIFNVKKIFCVDVNPERLRLVQQFGGEPLSAAPEDYEHRKKYLKEKTKHGVDVVVEACGQPDVMKEGLEFMRYGGHYVLLGMVHPQSNLSNVTGFQIIQKCASLHGTHNYGPTHLDQALSFLTSIIEKYPFDALVSEPFSLNEMDNAFNEAKSQKWLRVCLKLD